MSSITLQQHLASPRLLLDRRGQLRIFLAILFLSDISMLTLAFGLAYLIRFRSSLLFFESDTGSQESHILIATVLLPIWLILFMLSELYNPQYLFSSTQEYKKVFIACSIVFTLVVVGTFLVPVVRVSRGWIVIVWSVATSLVILSRFLLRHSVHGLRAHGLLTSRTLIVGTDEEARAIAGQLCTRADCGTQIVGFVDDYLPAGSKVESDIQVVGSISSLPSLVKDLDIDELIISISALPREGVVWIFQTFGHSKEVELRFSPGLFEIYTSGVRVKEIGNVHLVSMRKARLDGIETAAKAVTDYGLALLALVLLSPFLSLVGLLIKLDSPGPVFYRRRVVGGQGREFDAFKFRTMYANGDEILEYYPELKAELAASQKLKNDPRVTRIGRLLRKYSIDELPQLLNVLLGQMSLVGPRMITPAEVEKYGKWRLNLWTVKPGITGLWQISGRSDVCYADRIHLDMYYIRNYTLWFDLKILLQTIPAVLSRKGAY